MKEHTYSPALRKASGTLAFILIFLLLYALVENILLDKEPAYYKYRNYQALPRNSVDVLYIGNSHFNAAIDAQQIDQLIGPSFGFNYGVSGMRMEYAYFRFQNALRTQSPKLVVLDTFCLVPMAEAESGDNIISWSLDGIPLSRDKIQAVKELVPFKNWPAYLAPFIKYHARWDSLGTQDFIGTFDTSYYDWLGRTPDTTDRAMEVEDDHFSLDVASVTGTQPLDAKHLEYLGRFVRLAKAHGAQVLLLTVPYRQQFGQNSAGNGAMLNNTLRQQFADDPQVQLLDVNAYYRQLDFTYLDMRDDGHVNYSGAAKTSAFVGQYIREQYPQLADSATN